MQVVSRQFDHTDLQVQYMYFCNLFNLLLQIRGEDGNTSAPPSSPVLSEKEGGSLDAISEGEEDEYSDAESQEETKSESFSHPARPRLVTPKERSISEPALPTYDMGWGTKITKVKTTTSKPRFYAHVLLDSRYQ